MEENKEVSQQPVALLMQSTIAEVLAERITAMSTSPKMLEIIDKNIESCLGSIVKDTFCYYSDFSKKSKEAFQAALPGNIDSVIDLGRYNAMIQERLKATFASSGIAYDLIAKAENALKEAMDETLLPPVIKLSALCDAYIDCYASNASDEQWERPDFRLEEFDIHGPTQYMGFYFDKYRAERSSYGTDSSKYSLANSLSLAEVEGEEVDGNPVFRVYSGKLEDKFIQDIISTDLISSKWKKMMFALYYGQSKICIDCDPDDYYYPGND